MTAGTTHLRIVGFSPPYPNEGRATSSYLLRAPDGDVLVDCGHGAVAALLEATELDRLSAVVISHMHPDHFYDLIPLRNALLRRRLGPVPVHLPPGGRRILLDVVAATALPDDYTSPYFDLRDYEQGSTIELAGLTATALRTVHPIETFALRFALPSGARLVYTADTAWSEQVTEFAAGADLLLVEATDYPLDPVTPRCHLTPEEAGRLARSSGVGRAVITHYESAFGDEILERARSECPDIPIDLARTHDEYAL